MKLTKGDRYFLERCANAAHFHAGPDGRIGQPLPFPSTPDPVRHPSLILKPERVLAMMRAGLWERGGTGARLTDLGRQAVGLAVAL